MIAVAVAAIRRAPWRRRIFRFGIRGARFGTIARNEAALKANFISLEATRLRHVGSSPNPDRYDPDLWVDEFRFLSKTGQEQQLDLFFDYQTNVRSYPIWQEWLAGHRPATLVLWARYDPSFALAGASAYRDTLPSAELYAQDAGHFAMHEALKIAALTRSFMERTTSVAEHELQS